MSNYIFDNNKLISDETLNKLIASDHYSVNYMLAPIFRDILIKILNPNDISKELCRELQHIRYIDNEIGHEFYNLFESGYIKNVQYIPDIRVTYIMSTVFTNSQFKDCGIVYNFLMGVRMAIIQMSELSSITPSQVIYKLKEIRAVGEYLYSYIRNYPEYD